MFEIRDFRPEYAQTARVLCEMGATTPELAAAFSVDEMTVLAWRSRFSAFNNACQIGTNAANDRVKASLYKRAVGYDRKKQVHAFYKGSFCTGEITEEVRADVGAAQYWLNNMDSENWSNTQRVADADGKNLQPAVQIVPGMSLQEAAENYAKELE